MGDGELDFLRLIKSHGHVEIEHGGAVGDGIALRRGDSGMLLLLPLPLLVVVVVVVVLLLLLLLRIMVGGIVEKLLGALEMGIGALLVGAIAGKVEVQVEVEKVGKLLLSHGGHVVEGVGLRPGRRGG